MKAKSRFVTIIALGYIAFGLAYLLFPIPMAALTGLQLPSALGVIDVRGFYGGQLIGVGILLLYSTRSIDGIKFGLLLIAATLGGTAAGRLIGFGVDLQFPAMMVSAFICEAATAILAIYLAKGIIFKTNQTS